MPDLEYAYMPLYGTEPYADNGGLGGAVVTNSNLVVTAWQAASKFGDPPDYIAFGYILKPAAVNTLLTDQDRVAGLQAFGSRHSALAYINGDSVGGANDPVDAVAFVLNPPPEMKQLLQGSVTYNGGDPADPASYVVKKSLQSAYAWRLIYELAEAHNFQLGADDGLAMWSSYLGFSENTGDVFARIPFLKTNGADGVAPVFFDASIANGVNEMVEAVNDGEFYVCYTMPIQLGEESDTGNYCGMVYPHSGARG